MAHNTHLNRLLQRRAQLAEDATRALAHRLADDEAAGAQLRDVEDLLAMAHPDTAERCSTRWIERDAARLQAHLDGRVLTCPECQRSKAIPA